MFFWLRINFFVAEKYSQAKSVFEKGPELLILRQLAFVFVHLIIYFQFCIIF